jgi:hypothetical protein
MNAGLWEHHADSDVDEFAWAALEQHIPKWKVPQSNCDVAVQVADTAYKAGLELQSKGLEQDLLLHTGCRMHLLLYMWTMSLGVQWWGTIPHTGRLEVLWS